MREAVTNGEIELVYVNTEDQLADGMTKALQPALHRKCLDNYLSHYVFPWICDQIIMFYLSYVYLSMY